MQFYDAHYLKFLLFLPLLLVLGSLSARLWRKRVQKLGYEPLVREKLIPGYRRAEAGIRIFFMLLVFLCLLLALARPQWGESAKKVERKGVDILFLLDTSLSMLTEDIKPNRFETARHEIKSMIRKLKGDRVGLVVFSGSAYLQTPLTLDYSAFMLFLESVKVGHVPDPGSSLSSAFNYVLRIFPKEDLKYKVLILMTEGEDTLGGIEDSLKALKDAKVRVYAIGMGTEAGGPIPLKDQTGRQVGFKKDRAGSVVISRMDPTALKKIADETEGLFLPSTAGEREVDLLLKHLGSLGQKNINEKMITEKEDHYGFFIFMAFIFLLLEMFVRRSQSIKPALMVMTAFILFSGFLETPRSLNKQGNEEFAQKKYQSALAVYQKAKVQAPEDAAIRYNLGTALYQTSQYREAHKEFLKAVELSKQDPELQAKSYYNLGNTEYRLGNFEGAIKNYKEALKLDPKDLDAKNNLEFVQKQKSFFDKKNDEQKKDSPQKDQPQDKQNQDQNQQQSQQNQQDQKQQDPQNQNQDQQQQNQDQQKKDQNQQNQDQQNQQQDQNQQNQDQSQQNQSQQNQEGGQGKGSGQPQDQNSQPQNEDSKGQQNQDQPSDGQQGDQNKPEQEQSKNEPSKSEEQKNQDTPGQQGEQSPQQEKQQPDQGKNEPQDPPQKNLDKSGKQAEKSPQQEAQQSPEEEGNNEPQKDPQQEPQKQDPSDLGESKGEEEPPPDQTEPQNEEQPGGGQGQEGNQDIQPSEEQGQEPGQESESQPGEGQESAEKGQEKGNSGGSGAQYQGQMSLDNALKILDALHEGEKEFSDLRRPPAHRQQPSVEKDW